MSVIFAGPQIATSALPLLIGKRKILAEKLVEIMHHETLQHRAVDNRITLTDYRDTETGRLLLRITQTVNLPAEQAIRYWDALAVSVDQWIATLPQDQANVVYDEIITKLEWNEDEPTI